MRATAVIPAHDAAAIVGEAVAALKRDDPALDVLVVDDGSSDATAERAAAAGARVLRLPQRGGPARARNRGVEASPGADVILFTDADCRARPGFVQSLLAPFADPGVTGTKGAYLSSQQAFVPRFVQLEYEERYARMSGRREIDFIDTYACAYRRQALVDAGGFDERYDRPSTEDQELSFRVHARGGRFLFVPGARTEHTHAGSLGGYVRKKAKIGYFKAATLRAHPGKAVDDAHTPGLLKLQVAIAPLAVAAKLALAAAVVAWLFPSAAGETLPAALALRSPVVLASIAAVVAWEATTVPLTLRALRSDPALAPLVAPLSLARGLALGAGLALGVLREALGQGVLEPGAAPAPAKAEGGARP